MGSRIMELIYTQGTTSIDLDEKEYLIPKHTMK